MVKIPVLSQYWFLIKYVVSRNTKRVKQELFNFNNWKLYMCPNLGDYYIYFFHEVVTLPVSDSMFSKSTVYNPECYP
jgi:hypothetical protein